MRKSAFVAPLLLFALAGACGDGVAPKDGVARQGEQAKSVPGTIDTPQARLLRNKAIQLAQAELAKMNAIELVYRNKSNKYSAGKAEFSVEVFAKMYRRFTDYDLLDISLSESVLYPVTMSIEYKFDMLATPARNVTMPNSREQSRRDTAFRVHSRHTLRRRYSCDENGNLLRSATEYLGRPSFFRQLTKE